MGSVTTTDKPAADKSKTNGRSRGRLKANKNTKSDFLDPNYY